jgi:hypothetical protein
MINREKVVRYTWLLLTSGGALFLMGISSSDFAINSDSYYCRLLESMVSILLGERLGGQVGEILYAVTFPTQFYLAWKCRITAAGLIIAMGAKVKSIAAIVHKRV